MNEERPQSSAMAENDELVEDSAAVFVYLFRLALIGFLFYMAGYFVPLVRILFS